MKKGYVDQLPHGLYRVYWKRKHGGGHSLAAVGSDPKGNRWLAPTNWVSLNVESDWKAVKEVELIAK